MDADTKALIERVEKRIEEHIAGTNSKLDVLIDLTKQMATLQATQSHHGGEIVRLNNKVDTVEADNKQSLIRAHERIDGFHNQLREDIRVVQGLAERNRTDAHRNDDELRGQLVSLESRITTSISDVSKALVEKISTNEKSVTEKVGTVEKELHKWLNRGWGAWALVVALGGFFQWLASSAMESVKTASQEQVAAIKKMETRVNELEGLVTTIMANSRKQQQ